MHGWQVTTAALRTLISAAVIIYYVFILAFEGVTFKNLSQFFYLKKGKEEKVTDPRLWDELWAGGPEARVGVEAQGSALEPLRSYVARSSPERSSKIKAEHGIGENLINGSCPIWKKCVLHLFSSSQIRDIYCAFQSFPTPSFEMHFKAFFLDLCNFPPFFFPLLIFFP